MMEDLAMHMLEIIMNSVSAGSKHIDIEIIDSVSQNIVSMKITDDGKGMNKALLSRVADPFTTTRDTRKVGMGVSFMKGMTEQCGGSFEIKSKPGEGTTVKATARRDHIDRPPMGNLGEMMMNSIQAGENISFTMEYITDEKVFRFTTDEIKEQLDGVSMLEPEILIWIRDYINQEAKC